MDGCKVKDALQRKVQVSIDGKVEVVEYTMHHLFQDICDGYLSIDSELKRSARNAKARREEEIRLAKYEKRIEELTQQQVGNPYGPLSEEDESEDMFEAAETNLATIQAQDLKPKITERNHGETVLLDMKTMTCVPCSKSDCCHPTNGVTCISGAFQGVLFCNKHALEAQGYV